MTYPVRLARANSCLPRDAPSGRHEGEVWVMIVPSDNQLVPTARAETRNGKASSHDQLAINSLSAIAEKRETAKCRGSPLHDHVGRKGEKAVHEVYELA